MTNDTEVTRSASMTRLRAAVVGLPERVLLLGAGVAIVAFVAGALGVFYPLVVLPAIIVVWVISWRFVPQRREPTPREWLPVVLVIVGSIAWAGTQSIFVSESIVAWRDPGIYALQGIWLADHGSLSIPVGDAAQLAEGIAGASAAVGPWFDPGSQTLLLQGGSGLGSVVALGAWVFGISGALVVNIIVGAFALVAIYAAARSLAGPWVALAPVAVMAVSMPHSVYSRAPYSETLVLALYVAALVWLASACQRQTSRDFAVAGVLLGATAFVRVDSSVALIGASLALGASIAFIAAPSDRRAFIRGYLWFVGIALTMNALALLGLALNSPLYLRGLGLETLALVGLMLVVAVAAGFVAWLSTTREWEARWGASRRVAFVVGAAVAVVFAFWASRPLWLTSQLMFKPAYQSAVESYQRAEGLPINGTQSYEEYTLWWLAWYFGVVFLALAIVGVVMMVHRAFLARNPWFLIVSAVTLGTALLYFDVVRITPDQIWAFRRIYPFILPGLLLAFTFVVGAIVRKSRVVAWLAVILVGAQAALVFVPMIRSVESRGQVAEAEAACEAISSDTVVQLGSATPSNFALTLTVLCDVNVVTVADLTKVGSPDDFAQLLARLHDKSGGEAQFITFESRAFELAGQEPPVPTYSSEVRTWERRLMHTPSSEVAQERTMWVGNIAEDGTLIDVVISQ
jgi:hypothetical protein